jgi:hypothetical protein
MPGLLDHQHDNEDEVSSNDIVAGTRTMPTGPDVVLVLGWTAGTPMSPTAVTVAFSPERRPSGCAVRGSASG